GIASGDQVAVGGDCQLRELRGAGHLRLLLTRGGVPESNGTVEAARGERLAVRGEARGADLLAVALHRDARLERRGVEQDEGIARAAGGEGLAVGGVRD